MLNEIVWTNTVPKDYNLLQLWQQHLYDLFTQEDIDEFISKLKNNLDDTIADYNGKENVKRLISEILLNTKYFWNFLDIIRDWKIIEIFNLSKKTQEKIIDIIFDNYKEITNFEWKITSKYTWDTARKKTFNYAISTLIKNNPDYYFEKLLNLDQNSFRKFTQKYHQTAILYAVNNYEISEDIKKQFAEKLEQNIWIYNLKDNRSIWKRWWNYYHFIEKYNKNFLEEFEIERFFSWNYSILDYLKIDEDWYNYRNLNKNLEELLLDEFLNYKWDILEKIFSIKKERLFNLEKILLNEKFIDKLLEKYDDKKLLEYFILMNQKFYISKEDKKLLINILDKILVGDKKFKKNKIISLLNKLFWNHNTNKELCSKDNFLKANTIKFLDLNLWNITDVKAFLTWENFKNFLNLSEQAQDNLVTFIKILEIKNIDFEINNELINFIVEKSSDSGIFFDETWFDLDDIWNIFLELNLFFNEQINDYKTYFSDEFIKNFLINMDSYFNSRTLC